MDQDTNPEALIGKAVRIKNDVKDPIGGGPHMWAGKYGQIAGITPLGAYSVAVGKKSKQFALDELDIVADSAGTESSALAEQPVDTPRPELVYVPPLQAINSPTNPRRRRGLDLDSLTAFADNLRKHKVKSPILVRPLPPSRLEETAHLDPRPAYEIVAGERRWRGAQLAELPVMPMLVEHLSDEEVLEIQLIENIEREDLDDMEEAEGFALLRDRLGYTVEQIADRIGKGRGPSYVRKTMKLLDLTPESREAMYDGHLGRSTGLLVARYPAERQAAVVAFIKSRALKTSTGTEPAPFRTIAPEIYVRFNTVLKTAPFDLEDAELVPDAGACTTCPKRTGGANDLFGDAPDATEACADETCYGRKREAHVVRIRTQAETEGLQVIDGDEAKAARPSPHSNYLQGYVRVSDVAYTQPCDDDQERDVTFEDALRKLGRKAPKPALLIDPHTGVGVKVIPLDVADKLMPPDTKEAPKGNSPAVPATSQPPEDVAWRDGLVRRACLVRCFDAIRTHPRTVDELRLIARAIVPSDDSLPGVEDYMGWTDELENLEAEQVHAIVREKVEAMDAEQLGQFIAMVAIEVALTSWLFPEKNTELLGLYGIDVLAVRDKVTEDLKRQQGNDDAPADADHEDDFSTNLEPSEV